MIPGRFRAATAIGVGDRLRIRPSHTDPTVNLHDVFYVLDGDDVVDLWPIEARGYPEHRALLPSKVSKV